MHIMENKFKVIHTPKILEELNVNQNIFNYTINDKLRKLVVVTFKNDYYYFNTIILIMRCYTFFDILLWQYLVERPTFKVIL